MAEGHFNVYDKNGRLVITSTSNLAKIIGYFSTGTANGSITNTALIGKKIWATLLTQETAHRCECFPEFSFDSATGTIYWTFNTDTWPGWNLRRITVSFKVAYGVQ